MARSFAGHLFYPQDTPSVLGRQVGRGSAVPASGIQPWALTSNVLMSIWIWMAMV
jgi:hypothetical protein